MFLYWGRPVEDSGGRPKFVDLAAMASATESDSGEDEESLPGADADSWAVFPASFEQTSARREVSYLIDVGFLAELFADRRDLRGDD